MKIVEVGKYYAPSFGGIELVTEQSAKALAEQHSVHVVCFNHEKGEAQEIVGGVPVVRVRTQVTLFRQGISLGLGRHLNKLRPDLVHFHAPNFWAAAVIFAFLPNTPLIITHHCDVEGRALLRRLLIPIYAALVRRALAIIVASPKNAQSSRDLPRFARVVVIPLGVDDTRFQPVAAQPAEFGDRPVTIGFVGRLVWYKGLPVLLEAVSRMEGDARLIIIGDGPLRQQLEEKADNLNLSSRVTFAGNVTEEQKIELLRSVDIVAFPSDHRTEAFGLSQVEAQLLEKPVVATSLPTGASEIVVDNETGFIVPPGDPDALAAALGRLADSPELRQRFGRKGRERCLAHFTQAQYGASLRALVARLMDTDSTR